MSILHDEATGATRLPTVAEWLALVAGAGGGSGALTRTVMMSARTTTGAGDAVADTGKAPSFTASVSGTGAVSATVRIEGRNAANGVWFTLATITLSGTASAADGFGSMVRYMEYRAVLAAVSGTGAAVTVTMGS